MTSTADAAVIGPGERDATGGPAPQPRPPGDGQPGRQHVVLWVRLPDRPGALGAVAQRIGAVGGDITDLTVAARTGGIAEDIFHVDLPHVRSDVDVVGLLLAEIAEVDGVDAPSVSWPSDDQAACCPTP